MSISKLFAMLIAVSMLFAPFIIQSGSAMAAMPSDHHGQMAAMDHCEEQPGDGKDSKPLDQPCCAAMCAPIAIAMQSPVEPIISANTAARPTLEQFRQGTPAKLPTPPPRRP